MRLPFVAAPVVALFAVFAAPEAKARVEKVLIQCAEAQSLCPWYRPGVTPPKGWVEDRPTGQEQKLVVFVPSGTSLDEATAWIYARAVPNPKRTPLDEVVKSDHDRFREENPKITITALDPPPGRKPIRLYELVEEAEGLTTFERTATFTDTDREGNFYTIALTLSAGSREDLDATFEVFQQVLGGYK
jgi:hypothetical protein